MKIPSHSNLAKSLLIAIGMIIIISLVTSTVCYSPIDDIIPGGRDLTQCRLYEPTCFIDQEYVNRNVGGIVLMSLFLLITLLVYSCTKLASRWRMKSNEKKR